MTLAEQGYRATKEQLFSDLQEARLQRDFKFLLDRIEALESHWHHKDLVMFSVAESSEAGPAPSQAAETTTELDAWWQKLPPGLKVAVYELAQAP